MKYLALAAEQHAMITREQLADLGFTKHQIDHQVTIGRLDPLHPGVYGLAGVAPTTRRALMAACLAAGVATASHRSAAELLNIGSIRSVGPEITVPNWSRPRLKNVTVHRTNAMYACDITEIDGIPC